MKFFHQRYAVGTYELEVKHGKIDRLFLYPGNRLIRLRRCDHVITGMFETHCDQFQEILLIVDYEYFT